MKLIILHTNDLHGALTPEKSERIRKLKEESNLCLYLDSGDCIKAGNLAIPLKPDPAWELLANAGCDAGIIGNRETHVLESGFKAKLAGAKHPLLCANLRTKLGKRPLPSSLILEIGGLKVGLIGAMVPMVTEKMASSFASAYLWDPPIPVVVAEVEKLRSKDEGRRSNGANVDLLISLTHIGIKDDRELAAGCPQLDLILGGHSHTVLEQPERIGNTWICQGGSHARFVGRYIWEPGTGLINAELDSL